MTKLLLFKTLILSCAQSPLLFSQNTFLPSADQLMTDAIEFTDLAKNDPLKFKEKTEKLLQDLNKEYRFVFVHGYLGFLVDIPIIGSYMEANKADLKSFGVKSSLIHEVQPSSYSSIKDSAPHLLDALKKLQKLGNQKLVIIPHSMGAPTTIAALISDLEFTSKNIAAVFPVQGTFAGSGVADFLWDSNAEPIPENMSVLRSLFLKAMRLFPRLARSCLKGLPSLTHKECELFWTTVKNSTNSSDLLNEFSKKIVYFATTESPEETSFPMGSFARYLDYSYGQNDGLVEISDTSLNWLGNSISPKMISDCGHTFFKADHSALMTKMSKDPFRRQGMMAAIVKAITKL